MIDGYLLVDVFTSGPTMGCTFFILYFYGWIWVNWEADVVLYSVYHTLLRLCCYMTRFSWVACSIRDSIRRTTLLYAKCGNCPCHCLGRSSRGESWVNKLPSSQRFSEFRFVFNHQIAQCYVSRIGR